MWLTLIWFISALFVCWKLFCTIANLRIKYVTETKTVSVLLYENLKLSFLHDSEVSLHYWLLWPTDFCGSDISISTWWAVYAPLPHQIVRPSYGPVMYYTDGWCLTEMTFANSLVTAKKEVLTATCRTQLSQILFKIAWFHDTIFFKFPFKEVWK